MKPIFKTGLAAGLLAFAFNAQAEVLFTESPESGSTVETLTQITLNCSQYEFDYASNMTAGSVKVLKDGADFGGVTFDDNFSNPHYMYVNFVPALTEAGTYSVVIPANTITYFDMESGDMGPLNTEDVTYTYTVTGSGDVEKFMDPVSIYPTDGSTINLLEGMSNITLTFATKSSLVGEPKAIFASEDGSYSLSVDIVPFAYNNTEFFVQMINLTDDLLPTQDGMYTVTIPAKSIMSAAGEYNNEIKLTYEITGAEKVVVDEVDIKSIDIVTVEGTTVLTDNIALDGMPADTKIVFNTSNDLAVGYVTMQITDLNPLNPDEAIMSMMEAHALRTLPEKRGSYWEDDEAPFISVAGNLTFLKDHKYEVTYAVYDYETPPYSRTQLAEGKLTIDGNTQGYEYSDITIVSIDPEAGSIFNKADEAVINIEFSGAVKINQTKSFFYVDFNRKPFEGYVTMSDDNTKATLQFPPTMLEDAIGVVGMMIYVTDMDGKSLFFNYDAGDDSYYNLEYSCYLGTPDLDVDPGEGIVEELSQFIIRYNGRESVAWANNAEAGPIELRDLGSREGRVFGYVRSFETYETAMIAGDGGEAEGVVAIIGYLEDVDGNRITVNTPGKYVLCIPAATINMGDGFFGFTNKQTFINYTIEGEIEDKTVYDFDPTSKTVLFNTDNTIATVDLMFTGAVEVNPDTMAEVALYDAEGNKLDAQIESTYDADNFDPNMWTLTVAYNFVEKTSYELRIPQGVFGDTEWASDNTYAQYNTGHANAAFNVTLYYETLSVNGVAAEKKAAEVYNLQGIKIGTVEDVNTLPAGLYIVNGNKVYVK